MEFDTAQPSNSANDAWEEHPLHTLPAVGACALYIAACKKAAAAKLGTSVANMCHPGSREAGLGYKGANAPWLGSFFATASHSQLQNGTHFPWRSFGGHH